MQLGAKEEQAQWSLGLKGGRGKQIIRLLDTADATGCFRRVENGVGVSLAWGQKEKNERRELYLDPAGRKVFVFHLGWWKSR